MPRPSDFGEKIGEVAEFLKAFTRTQRLMRKTVSLMDMVAEVRAKFRGVPGMRLPPRPVANRSTGVVDPDPLKFSIYRLVKAEKIWFGKPGTFPKAMRPRRATRT